MALLVRKISMSKWRQNDIINGEDVSADAITNCMKTDGNTLSTWEISKESKIDDAVLAIVSCSDHLDTIDVTYLDSEVLEKKGILTKSSKGKSPIEDLNDFHINLVNLTYPALGIIANVIVENIKKEKFKRYTRGMLKKLLKVAIESGILEQEKLSCFIQKTLDEYLEEV